MKNKKTSFLILLILTIVVKPIFAEEKSSAVDTSLTEGKNSVMILKYQNGFLDADVKSTSIKDIFEEIKKQTGMDYEIEKEILEQKVTISIKDKELTQAIKDILNTIGNPSYMLSYKKDKVGKYEVSGITIKKQGAMETAQVAKRELQPGEMEVGPVTDDPKWNAEFKNLKKYRIRAKDVDLNELLEKISRIVGVKILAVRIDKKITIESEGSMMGLLKYDIMDKIRPKIYGIKTHSTEVDITGNVIKEGYYEVTQLSYTEIQKRREEAEQANKDGEKLIEKDRYEEAIDVLEHISDPDDIKSNINLGKIYLLTRMYSQAIDYFNTVLEINSTNAEALLGLIEVYEKTDNREKALENLGRYILLEKDAKKLEGAKRKIIYLKDSETANYYLFLKKGDECRANGDIAKSKEEYENAIKIKPNLPSAYKRLGEIYRAEKEYEKAEAMYKKVLERDNKDFDVYFYLAEVYSYAGKIKEAIELLNEIPKFYPDKSEFMKMRIDLMIEGIKEGAK